MSAADGAGAEFKIQSSSQIQMTDDQAWAQFVVAVRQLGIELTPDQLERLRKYERLLREWNERVNLVSRKDIDRLVGYHFLDSLTASALIPQGSTVCDVGSGGGLPGIPLKLVRDDIRLALVESTGKKARFLELAVSELKLGSTIVRAERAESMSGLKFDVVLSRLVGKTDEVAKWVARLLNPGGRIILYKSATVEAELKQAQPALNRLHLEVREIRDFPLPPIARRLVVLARA
jgi:16S rRNA (guanine527-N7)-methyltransferase